MYASTSPSHESRSGPGRRSAPPRTGPTLQRADTSPALRLARLVPAAGQSSLNGLVQNSPPTGRTRVGQAGDRFEQEAEQTADRVMHSPLVQRKASEQEETAQARPLIQLQTEEEEETAQAKPLSQRQAEEEEEPVQAKGSPPGSRVSRGVQAGLDSSKGGGAPLPATTRGFMESRFGRDFSQVRIHTGSEAVQMSQELKAQAFTRGSDIYFNAGRFDPGSSQGRHLLAHELTHTVQQGQAAVLPRLLHRQEETATTDTAEQIDMAAELAASNEEAAAAVDPTPATEAKQEALVGPAAKGKEKTAAEAEEKEAVEEKPGEEAPGEPRAEKEKKKAVGASFSLSLPKAEPKGVVGQYLETKSAGVLGRVLAKVTRLASNEKRHDPAAEKLAQSEAAVKPPKSEGAAQSNSEQVDKVDAAKSPETDPAKAKGALLREVEAAVPSKMKEINEFKSQGKAKVVGNRVLGKVKEDTAAVQTTYQAIEEAGPPKAPAQEPVELPPQEEAMETESLNLGQGAVPPLKEEHTDFGEYDRKSDELLQKEGLGEEQLNQVDEGDLYQARQERDGVKKKVTEEPAAIQEFARHQAQRVNTSLKAKETQTKAKMRDRRDSDLAATKAKQQKTKSALELKREEVAKRINTIYQTAKESITAKLALLEKQSLKRFDQGQAKASRQFEYEVHRDVNRWKRKRYSGFWGPAKWVKDKICGINDFPEVKAAFDRARANYVLTIDLLIQQITMEANLVIVQCKVELALARAEIKTYVDGLGPALKKVGQQALTDMKAKLDALAGDIDKKKQQLAQKLADKREEAIKKIDEKIEKMKEEMAGALAKLGNLLLEAALKFFRWALKKAGYDGKQLMGILNKGKAVVKKIVGDPIGFLGNIVDAVKLGIHNFEKNIKKHLVGGLISWLTGAMGDVGIQLPERFDLKGVLSFVLQVLGLTWANIRAKLVKRLGEKTVGMVEKGVTIVKRLVTEGPMALWAMIKEKAAEIKAKVMEGIRNWAIVELVKQGIIKLVSFLNPVGALIQAILAIYNTIMFFVENWDRIVQFVKTVFRSIADIAMGRLSAAAAAVERALAMTIPIILNFLARLLNLSGIGKAVKKIIHTIRAPIDRVLNKAVDFIANKAKSLFGRGKAMAGRAKAAAKKGAGAVTAFFSVGFRMGTSNHKLTTQAKGKRLVIVMRSTPAELIPKIEAARGKTTDPKAREKLDTYHTRAKEIDALLATNPSGRELGRAKQRLGALASSLQKFGAEYGMNDLFPVVEDENEGKVGRYRELKGRKGLTPDHEPQNAVMLNLKNLKLSDGQQVFTPDQTIASYSTGEGVCMQLNRARHMQTRTYGSQGTGTKKAAFSAMGVDTSNFVMKGVTTVTEARGKVKSAMNEALLADLAQVKKIYADPAWHLSKAIRERIKDGRRQVRNKNLARWPQAF